MEGACEKMQKQKEETKGLELLAERDLLMLDGRFCGFSPFSKCIEQQQESTGMENILAIFMGVELLINT